MSQHPSLTIGIPAHNEGGNIAALLRELLVQSSVSFDLEKIIVYCDGCTDNTVAQIRLVDDARIVTLVGDKRQGIAHGLNQISHETTSEILVIVNADIIISDPMLIEKLIMPILSGRADLTAGSIEGSRSEVFIERVLSVSMEFKKTVFAAFRNGNNMYSCVGPVRAFSQRLYQQTHFQSNMADDMLSYFRCISLGYDFVSVPQARVFYRLPNRTSDYLKQSTRYLRYLDQVREEFGKELFTEHAVIPLMYYIEHALIIMLRHPIYFSAYILICGYRKMIHILFRLKQNDHWTVVQSTKIAR